MYSEYQPSDVRAGDIMKAKPKNFDPRPAGTGGIGQHPVIVLRNPDMYGYVEVATMSHSHPNGPPTQRASLYGLPIDPIKGESTVCVGRPQKIHVSNLRPHSPYGRMHPEDFNRLYSDIAQNCPEFAREANTTNMRGSRYL